MWVGVQLTLHLEVLERREEFDMSSILKHIVRNTLEKKLRTMIVVLTIVFATAILFIGLSLNTIINDTYQTMVQGAFGKADLVLTKDGDDEGGLYAREYVDLSHRSIEQVNDFIEATGTSFLHAEYVTALFIGMDKDTAVDMELIAPFTDETGYDIDKHDALISQQAAEAYELAVGDVIEVTVNEQAYDIRIGGISETNGIFYAAMDELLFVVEPELVHKMYGTGEQFSRTLLTVNTDHINETIDQLTAANEGFLVEKADQSVATDRDEETFQMTMVTAITIIILISAYVILSITKMIVTERMPVVGTFRSIGTSKRMMNRILALELLVYGVVGALLGLLFAFLLLPTIADVFNEYKDVGVETKVVYSPLYISIAALFGVLFPVLVGKIHIVRSNRKPLKEIILQTTQTGEERSISSAVIGICLLMASFVFYGLNGMDQLGYAALSVLCLIIGLIVLVPSLLALISHGLSKIVGRSGQGELIVAIKNMGNNKTTANNSSMIIIVVILLLMVGMTTKGLDDYLAGSIKKDFDIVIEQLDEDLSFYTEVESVEGVESYRIDYMDVADYYVKGTTGEFTIIGVDDVEEFAAHTSGIVFEGDAKERMKHEPEGILIDAYQAKRFDLDIGDTVTLQPYDQNGQSTNGKGDELEIVISGLINSYGNGPGRVTALVQLDFFNTHFHGTYNQIGVLVQEGYEDDDVKSEIASLYQGSGEQVITFDDKLSGQVETIDTLFIGITLIVLLGMVIGLLGITNNLLVSFIQRKKEFSVLYSVCMSRRQLIKMQLYEMLATFIAVVLIGWAGGMLMNIVLEKLLYAIALRVELSFNYSLFWLLCGVVFLILLVSSLITVRKMIQMNMLKELRYE